MSGKPIGLLWLLATGAGAAMLAVTAVSGVAHAEGKPRGSGTRGSDAWCAPETETLFAGMCAYVPKDKTGSVHAHDAKRQRSKEESTMGGDELVIYLHGVISPGSGWQVAPQRGMVRLARRHHFTVIMPRGRRGIGPKGMKNWWTWPTSAAAQRRWESELLGEWQRAKRLLEQRRGKPFERVYVVGFSNGAYYGSSLALRGRIRADGYMLVAGGSAPEYRRRAARKVAWRPPIYVGFGYRDRTATKDCMRLAHALRRLHWPRKVVGRRRVGHTLTDSQMAEALRFFRRYYERHPQGPHPLLLEQDKGKDPTLGPPKLRQRGVGGSRGERGAETAKAGFPPDGASRDRKLDLSTDPKQSTAP